ncbi:hypothetical protein RIF29_14435 [Crotalaria pallida]|uniref:Uncharacterized protein n=1 Tax=Crotalaria pallida TaxID=3830 RepID=A0AAN9II96_CROPI
MKIEVEPEEEDSEGESEKLEYPDPTQSHSHPKSTNHPFALGTGSSPRTSVHILRSASERASVRATNKALDLHLISY